MMWTAVVSPLTDTITQVGRRAVASLMGLRMMTNVVAVGLKIKNESNGMLLSGSLTAVDQIWYHNQGIL